jgi:hypothetical protein
VGGEAEAEADIVVTRGVQEMKRLLDAVQPENVATVARRFDNGQLSFDATPAAVEGPERRHVDFLSLAARGVVGIADWTWRKSECVDPPGTFLVTGAVYPEKFKSGPRKGRTNYSITAPNTDRNVVVTRAQVDAAKEAWSVETGLCHACSGNDTTLHKPTKPCKACGGSGKRQ